MSQQMKSQPTRRSPVLMTVAAAAAVAAVLSVAGLTSGSSVLTDIFNPTAAKVAAAAPAVAQAAPINSSTATKSIPAKVAATSTEVMIENYAYSPAALTVKVGTTVTWTNMDTAPHTVTVSSGPVKFASPNLQKGETFSYTFTEVGTYSYYCAVHPDMKGTVTVTGTLTTPTPTPTTPTPTHPSMPGADACGGAMSAVDTFLAHLYAGHLEPSLGQQVADILDADQYVKTHTVLIENMVKPLLGGSQSALDTFLAHLYAGHLEPSLTQQVADILDADQYVKTHTVLIENMVKPLLGGSSSC